MKARSVLITVLMCVTLVACGQKEETAPTAPTSINTGNFDVHIESSSTVAGEVEPSRDTSRIPLDVNGQEFYNVYVPKDVQYATDYSKYVYGENPTFTITVVSGVSDTNFGKSCGISSPENVTQNVSRSKVGKKGVQQCAILLSNDRAVVANCYDCPEVFATILDGMKKHSDCYTVTGVEYVKTVKELKTLSYSGKYGPSAINKTEVGKTCLYKYEDGCLYVSTELRQFDQTKEFMLTKLNTVSGKSVDTVYYGGNVFYASAGEFHLALYQENFNTTIVLFGSGDETLCNMIFLLNQITDK